MSSASSSSDLTGVPTRARTRGAPSASGRYVARVALAGQPAADLSGALSWREARRMLAALRRIFRSREARAEGWVITGITRGFVASRLTVSASFSIAELPATELVGRRQRLPMEAGEPSGSSLGDSD